MSSRPESSRSTRGPGGAPRSAAPKPPPSPFGVVPRTDSLRSRSESMSTAHAESESPGPVGADSEDEYSDGDGADETQLERQESVTARRKRQETEQSMGKDLNAYFEASTVDVKAGWLKYHFKSKNRMGMPVKKTKTVWCLLNSRGVFKAMPSEEATVPYLEVAFKRDVKEVTTGFPTDKQGKPVKGKPRQLIVKVKPGSQAEQSAHTTVLTFTAQPGEVEHLVLWQRALANFVRTIPSAERPRESLRLAIFERQEQKDQGPMRKLSAAVMTRLGSSGSSTNKLGDSRTPSSGGSAERPSSGRKARHKKENEKKKKRLSLYRNAEFVGFIPATEKIEEHESDDDVPAPPTRASPAAAAKAPSFPKGDVPILHNGQPLQPLMVNGQPIGPFPSSANSTRPTSSAYEMSAWHSDESDDEDSSLSKGGTVAAKRGHRVSLDRTISGRLQRKQDRYEFMELAGSWQLHRYEVAPSGEKLTLDLFPVAKYGWLVRKMGWGMKKRQFYVLTGDGKLLNFPSEPPSELRPELKPVAAQTVIDLHVHDTFLEPVRQYDDGTVLYSDERLTFIICVPSSKIVSTRPTVHLKAPDIDDCQEWVSCILQVSPVRGAHARASDDLELPSDDEE